MTATYARVAGENASPPTYHITATLSRRAGGLDNYIITNDGAEFTINKRARDVDDEPGEQDLRGSRPEPADDGERQQLRRGGQRDGDLQPRGGGEREPADLSHHRRAERHAAGLDNYIITNDGAEFTINKRLATWTTNPASKTYGDPDPHC